MIRHLSMCFDGRVSVTDIAAWELVELSVIDVVFAGSDLIIDDLFDIYTDPFMKGSDRNDFSIWIDAAESIKKIVICLSEGCRFFIGGFPGAVS